MTLKRRELFAYRRGPARFRRTTPSVRGSPARTWASNIGLLLTVLSTAIIWNFPLNEARQEELRDSIAAKGIRLAEGSTR